MHMMGFVRLLAIQCIYIYLYMYILFFSEPHGTPQNFSVVSETETSVNLSWKPIASADQRGFLTHYRLCSVKMNSDQSTGKITH